MQLHNLSRGHELANEETKKGNPSKKTKEFFPLINANVDSVSKQSMLNWLTLAAHPLSVMIAGSKSVISSETFKVQHPHTAANFFASFSTLERKKKY